MPEDVSTSDAAPSPHTRRRLTVRRLLLLTVLAGAGLGLYSRMARHARDAADASICSSHLAQIGEALRQYHADHGRFPPAFVADERGRPLHSWRVLILPYLRQDALYRAYDFREPWDGPHNRKLADRRPSVFACANPRNNAGPAETSYVVIVGPRTPFPGAAATSLDDLGASRDRIILAAEYAHSGISWLEPRDLKADAMSFRINDPVPPGLSGTDGRFGAGAVLGNFQAVRLRESLTEEALKAMIFVK